MIIAELKVDATQSEIRFAPIGNGRYIICVPDGESCLTVRISQEQALALYRLIRLYLRNPLTQWGPEAVASAAGMAN